MSGSFDAVVTGAGIVGAACALELASAGMHVAVIERRGIGSGGNCSGAWDTSSSWTIPRRNLL